MNQIIENEINKPYKRVPDFDLFDGDEEQPDYILFGWKDAPLGGMNDLMGVFETFEESRNEAVQLAKDLEIDQYQIVDGDSLEVLEEGSVKDLVPMLIN